MSTLPLGVEGRNHVCVSRGKGEGNKRKKQDFFFFFLTPAGREEGFSPSWERAEVTAQVTDGPQGLVGVSIRVSDELV